MLVSRDEKKARIKIVRENKTQLEYVSACDYFPTVQPIYFFQTYIKNFGRKKIVLKTSSLDTPL
jgi:hypothetical protein